jgi:hypothetical protein
VKAIIKKKDIISSNVTKSIEFSKYVQIKQLKKHTGNKGGWISQKRLDFTM